LRRGFSQRGEREDYAQSGASLPLFVGGYMRRVVPPSSRLYLRVCIAQHASLCVYPGVYSPACFPVCICTRVYIAQHASLCMYTGVYQACLPVYVPRCVPGMPPMVGVPVHTMVGVPVHTMVGIPLCA